MKILATKDYSAIARLNKTVHDLHVQLYPEIFKEYKLESMEQFFQKLMEDRKHTFLLLEVDHAPIGYAWIEIKTSQETDFIKSSQSVYVHQISVDREAQQKGLGSKLMEEIYAFARLNGITRIALDYWAENENAAHFYKKEQFLPSRQYVYRDL